MNAQMNEAPLAATSEASQEEQRQQHDSPASGGDGQGQCARFARLEYDEGVGKKFARVNGNLLTPRRSKCYKATARVVVCNNIQDVENVFRCATDRDVFVSGVPRADELRVTTKGMKEGEEIARSKQDLPFPCGPGIMFLDNDYPAGTGDDQFWVYTKAVPVLAKASYVCAPSTSSWLRDSESGEVLKGEGGQHVAIPVLDATDIPRAMLVIHQRLILDGRGRAVVTGCGTVNIRTPADLAMRTSNQPLFQRAVCCGDVVQNKEPHIVAHEGEVYLLDTRLIPDLSPVELSDLELVERSLRDGADGAATAAREKWIEARVQRMVDLRGVTREAAQASLEATVRESETGHIDLHPGFGIELADGRIVDVADLLASPNKYDLQDCLDPLEPEYSDHTVVGKFYAESLTIHSFAHGGRTFHLQHVPIDISGILNQVGGLRDACASDWQAPGAIADTPAGAAPSGGMAEWTPPIEIHPLAKFVDISTLPKVPRMIIPGLIMHGVVCISGSRGVGKTTCLLPLAAAAAGLHAPGYEFAPKHWRHVIYISEQLEQAAIIMDGLIDHAGLGIQREDVKDRMHFVEACRLPPEKVAEVGKRYKEQFTRHVNGVKIDPLVVFDTKSAVLSLSDENDNAEGSKAMAHLKQGFEGLPVWIIGHVTKADMKRSDASELTQRGAGSFEDDAVQTAYLIADPDKSRWLCLGKKRFEAEYDQLLIACGFAKTRAQDEFGELEDVGMRWGIVRVPLISRAALRVEAVEASKDRAEGDRRKKILDALRVAQKRGTPLNRAGLKTVIGGKAQAITDTVAALCREHWIIEVEVPPQQRLGPSKSSFLVALTTVEHDAVTIYGEPVPQRVFAIPPTWGKPDFPPVPDAATSTSEISE